MSGCRCHHCDGGKLCPENPDYGNTGFSWRDLRPWRKRLGLTQRKMGEKLGLTEGSYRQWEHGRMTASKRLILLINALSRIEELEERLREIEE